MRPKKRKVKAIAFLDSYVSGKTVDIATNGRHIPSEEIEDALKSMNINIEMTKEEYDQALKDLEEFYDQKRAELMKIMPDPIVLTA